MKRVDLLRKYKQDFGKNLTIAFWDNSFKADVKTYVEWLEEQIPDLEQKRQDAGDRIYRLGHGNFIMRVRHLASVQELDDWDEKYKTFVESIPPDRYSEFLSLYENDGLKRVMDVWL
jgi:hypothetical protein